MYASPSLFARLDFDSANLVFRNPQRVISATSIDEVILALTEVERAVDNGLWAVGYVGYEAAPALDPAMRVRLPGTLSLEGRGAEGEGFLSSALPLLCFGLFQEPTSTDGPEPGDFQVGEWTPSLTHGAYAAGIDQIREAIAGGYTYQVNYTMRLRSGFDGDDLAFYHRLRRSQNGPYSAYLDLGRFRILSASPELFFQRNGDVITTRPMKGTVARGRWPGEDQERRDWLSTSEKNRAENVMIVDLLRNDLGRIAKPGTVKTSDLFKVETYPTVFQMTSTVSADLRPNTGLVDILRALFPCGSVTGAPKISTMSLIANLETDPRGVYCGAIGVIKPGGDATFNVAIRTVTVDTETGTAEYGTGGGITWDSTAVDEYAEASTKAAFLSDAPPDFDLLETLCLRDGEYVLLERHIDRIAASATYFGCPVDIDAIRTALANYAADRPTDAYRVRLLVSETGHVKVESQPLGDPPSMPTIAIANFPIDSRDRFLYHKTTNRGVYERHKAEHSAAFDVLLWNERGEATEFTIGNLIVEIDGKKYTPPIDGGLLPGTMRAEMLDQGEVEEKVMTVDEVRGASTVWLVNSVRGWVEVRLI